MSQERKQMAALHLRLGAKAIDIALIFFITLGLIGLLGVESPIPSCVFLGLFLLSDGISGQSIGKRVFKIRVIVFRTQKPIGFGRSIVRNSLALSSLLLLPAIINYILYVSYFRILGDFLAGTCVIKET